MQQLFFLCLSPHFYGADCLFSFADEAVAIAMAQNARMTMATARVPASAAARPGSARRQLQTSSVGNIVGGTFIVTLTGSENTDAYACEDMPCLNEGACWPIDADQCTCDCEGTGYSGSTCDESVDARRRGCGNRSARRGRKSG